MNSRIGYICSAIALVAILASSCRKDIVIGADSPDEGLRLRSIAAVIDNGQAGTKAHDQVEPIRDSLELGRYDFVAGDIMIFTKIQRTANPLAKFSYAEVGYGRASEGAWSPAEGNPDVYWTDAHSPHTFIAYSLPQQPSGRVFKWVQNGVRYDGQVHFTDAYVDYTSDSGYPETVGSHSGWEKLRWADLLLAHTINQEHDDPTATILFKHALSSVRVKIELAGFYTTLQDMDHESKVLSATVKALPIDYYWDQSTSAAVKNDDSAVKDMKLFCPRPDGDKNDQEKDLYTFTYYGITVPHTHSNLELSFRVKYPNPKKEGDWIERDFDARLNSVDFRAGYCTAITVTLSHRNDEITIGADYTDWEYVDTPDEGELAKNTTFLASSDRSKVTIHTDSKATIDDATWLYKNADNEIVDIYGNDGTRTKPYLIKTAYQFLSFAYEVNEGGLDFTNQYVTLDAGLYLQASPTGSGVKWPGIGKTDVESCCFNGTLTGGTRIIIKRLEGQPLFNRIGPLGHIGHLLLLDVLEVDGPAAFAAYNKGIICGAEVSSPGRLSGGSFKLKNALTLEGLNENETDNRTNITFSAGTPPNRTGGTTTVAAPIVAYNEGIIIASFAIGKFDAVAKRTGGIVGYNNGAMVVCYSAVDLSSSAQDAFYRGTVAYNRYDPDWITHSTPRPEYVPRQSGDYPNGTLYGALTYCFFDRDVAKKVNSDLAIGNVYAKTTNEMQSSKFIGSKDQSNVDVNTLNGNIHVWASRRDMLPNSLLLGYYQYYTQEHHVDLEPIISQIQAHFKERYYEFHVADYPWVY